MDDNAIKAAGYFGHIYMLDEFNNPVKVERTVTGVDRWCDWLLSENRVVSQSVSGDVKITTTFTGMNMPPYPEPPLLWQTVIEGGPRDGQTLRHASLADAEYAHFALWTMAAGKS
jgi:hypothetical protein